MFKFIFVTLLFFFPSYVYGQSVLELRENYNGSTTWDASTGTLTFTSSGTINLPEKKHNSWAVPKDVKIIVIDSNVTVTGRFDTSSKITIEGKDKKTSKIFGTNTTSYAKTQNGGNADALSAIRATSGDITIQNLTSINPKGYAFTHRGGGFMTILSCIILDTRGGHQNNSDGIVTWGGGLVKDCYLSTGDDNIKVYGNITVENTEIVMVDNAVPIQFGWGSYGSGAKGTFKNITISGTSGRGAEGKAIISARTGTYNKTIVIDGIKINNPNASLVNFTAGGNYNISITNADISVSKFYTTWNTNTNATVTICGSLYDKNSIQKIFKCDVSTSINNTPNGINDICIYPNPAMKEILINGAKIGSLIRIYNTNGQLLYNTTAINSELKINSEMFIKGIHIVHITCNESFISKKIVI
jgi:hypothetical protein